MPEDEPAIIGFRQDRVGARIMCLVDVLRLRRLADPRAQMWWLGQPDGPYPDLADPTEIFEAGFAADLLRVIPALPDLAGRRSLPGAAPTLRPDDLAARIAAGERWHTDAGFDPTRFLGERPAGLAAETRAIFAALPWSAPIAAARDRALRRLARLGGTAGAALVAIHVRRGDILDADPWSHSAWPSKYVPDEFFHAALARTEGPVLAFSDTPAAVTHLARGQPRIVQAGDLVGAAGADLTVAQRDVLDLLLMTACQAIAAPAYSAFSRSASLLGGSRLVVLPGGLPPEPRLAAYDALLDRVIAAPDSFFAPGDLAQSTHHVAPHATLRGRGAELLAAFADRGALIDRFPFLPGDLAGVALALDRRPEALALSQAMLANPRLRPRDQIIANQVALMAAPDPDPAARGAAVLGELFIGRRSDGIILPRLAYAVLGGRSPAGAALMMGPQTVRRIARALSAGAAPDALPTWVALVGWPELIENGDVRRRLHGWPPLARKLAPMSDLLARAEAAAAGTGPAPDLGRPDAEALAMAAAALILDNRLMRAIRLMEWVAARRPRDAAPRKRLADACFAAGNAGAGWRWLQAAHEAAPDNPLICLSAATRETDPAAAAGWIDRARVAWPGLKLTERLASRLAAAQRAGGPAVAAEAVDPPDDDGAAGWPGEDATAPDGRPPAGGTGGRRPGGAQARRGAASAADGKPSARRGSKAGGADGSPKAPRGSQRR